MSSRREFLSRLSAFGLAVAGFPRLPMLVRPRFIADPFSLGVGSGDPGPDGVVLWSRLAPDPLRAGEGLSYRQNGPSRPGARGRARRSAASADRPSGARAVHPGRIHDEAGAVSRRARSADRDAAGGEASRGHSRMGNPPRRSRTEPFAHLSPFQAPRIAGRRPRCLRHKTGITRGGFVTTGTWKGENGSVRPCA